MPKPKLSAKQKLAKKRQKQLNKKKEQNAEPNYRALIDAYDGDNVKWHMLLRQFDIDHGDNFSADELQKIMLIDLLQQSEEHELKQELTFILQAPADYLDFEKAFHYIGDINERYDAMFAEIHEMFRPYWWPDEESDF